MGHRVFLAVLLALVLSLSKGENDTTPTTTATVSTGENATTLTTTATNSTGENDTTPTTTATVSTGENATTPTTTATNSTGENATTPTATATVSTGETDTTPTTTVTNSTGENATTPTATATVATGENATTPTTTATNSTGENATTPTATATVSTGENATTPTTTATNSTGENATTPTATATVSTGGNATTPTTTATNSTGENDTTPTTAATDITGDFCNPDPCGTNLATCVPLNSNYNCLCQYGFYYWDKDCHRGKIFPGVITLQGPYDSSVLIVNSTQYEEMFKNITQFFDYAFRILTGYAQTVIVEIHFWDADPMDFQYVCEVGWLRQLHSGSPTYNTILLTESRASDRIKVTVINLFMENTTANNDTVNSAVMNATKDFPDVIEYTGTTYCALLNCDAKTTVCEEDEFPQCICQSNFSKTEWDVNTCSDCSKDCFDKENMYCAKENGVPTCKCMPNFEIKDGKCVSCPVGYSGDNCENNSELILIIVGTVFGAIILCLAIAVTVVSIRAKHKQDPEKKKLLRSGHSNLNTSDDRQPTMFPRVRTTTGHANPGYQPNNPYEMRDFDDLYEESREPEGFRMHNRN